MIRRFCCSIVPATLLLPLLLTGHMGGFSTLTVADLPDYLVAQQPTELAFTVRMHGQKLLLGLSPSVEATDGSRKTTVVATATKRPGEYAVSLTVPEPGDWTISVAVRPFRIELLPIRAVGAGALDRPSYTPAEQGMRLFIAKGCITCHNRTGLETPTGRHKCYNDRCVEEAKIGPHLVPNQFTADYLARFLADPSIRPRTKAPFPMPNLELKPHEIDALIAFVNTEMEKVPGANGSAKKSD